MLQKMTALLIALLALSAGPALAWDPNGAGNAPKWNFTEDEARRLAPAFEFGLKQSRDSARASASMTPSSCWIACTIGPYASAWPWPRCRSG